jgi:hypothetical protein
MPQGVQIRETTRGGPTFAPRQEARGKKAGRPRLQYAPHWHPFPPSIRSDGAQTPRGRGLDHHEDGAMVQHHLFDVHPRPNRRTQRRSRCTHGGPHPFRERRCHGAVKSPRGTRPISALGENLTVSATVQCDPSPLFQTTSNNRVGHT